MQKYSWVFGGVGGLLVIAFLVSRYAMGIQDTPWMVVGGAGAALLGLYLWLDRDQITETAGSRSVRYSTFASLSVVLALAVAVALVVLGKRYDERWDLTRTGRYTLSEQSIKVAAGLSEPVQVLGFFQTASTEENNFRDLVEGYQGHTDKLQLELVDPVTEPMMAQQFAITSSFGTVVLVQGERRQRLESNFTEEGLTNALIRLASAKEHVLCFTAGHGERELDDDMSTDGIGGVIIKMEDLNYTAKPFQPLREGRVPAECEVVVVVGPQVDFLPPEREVLARYVAGGGALMVMLDPLQADALAADMARYGFKVGNDLILEDNPTYQLEGGDPSYVVLDRQSMDFHPIVNDLKAIALLRVVRSVDVDTSMQGINLQVLARTSEQAWAEQDIASGASPTPDPERELIGRVPMMAVAEVTDGAAIQVGETVLPEATRPEATEGATQAPADGVDAPAEPQGETAPPAEAKAGGRVVVFGDSDFVSNGLLVQGNNQDLFLNTVAWLVGEEDQVSVRSNEAGAGTLTMTAGQGILVWLISLLFMPALAGVVAIATWMRRRSL